MKVMNRSTVSTFRNVLPPYEFLLLFNQGLDSLSNISDLNEGVIEDLLGRLEGRGDDGGDLYWLTLARINELALICAANYANNCEFRLVGDLLLNPRRILIYMKGSLEPVTKIRHMALTEQFRHVADSPGGVIQWLKKMTLLKTEEEALLPHLHGLLSNSGRLRRSYLNSVMERKMRIATLTGFLASSGFKDGAHFQRWMKSADPADLRMVESMLCRFNNGVFSEMGEDIRLMGEDPSHSSRFLTGRGEANL
jgi:hypothetical protein